MEIPSQVIRLIILVSLFSFYSCLQNKGEKKEYLVLTNANVITMESDEVARNQTVVIQNGYINSVGPTEEINIPKRAVVIDAHGKFIIPGLADMHIHIDHPDVLKVNLAYGVTTVMNYRGLSEHLILRELSEANKIFSPNIFTTGDYMEGYPATMPGFLSFDNPEDARNSVKEQKEKGYDFIKVYRNLDSVLHSAICEEAALNDMTVVGHLSPELSLEQSLIAGQKVIAHTEELMYFFSNENDTSKIVDLIELLKRYEVTYTPNLAIFRSLFLQVESIDSLNSLAHLKYLQPALFQSWRKENNNNHSRGLEWAKFMRERFSFLQEVTRQIKLANIQILASTDAPTSGAFPGLAVHQELKELVEIGFTPFEALQTATQEPGIFIKKYIKNAENFGLIKEDYRADLLLLDKNPLENIDNISTISGLVKNGTLYSKDSIDNVLIGLDKLYNRISPIVKQIETEIEKEHITKADSIFRQAKNEYPEQLFLGYYTMWYAGYRFLYHNRRLTEDEIRAEKAIKFYKMYLEDYPDLHGSHYLLGMAYKAKKDSINAIASFNRSLALHPYNPYALRQLKALKATE